MGDNELYENIGFIKAEIEALETKLNKVEVEGHEDLVKEVGEFRLKLEALKEEITKNDALKKESTEKLEDRIVELEGFFKPFVYLGGFLKGVAVWGLRLILVLVPFALRYLANLGYLPKFLAK